MSRLTRNRWVALAGVFAWFLSIAPAASGSSESRELLRQGHAKLNEGKYEEALKNFAAAVNADSQDGEAVYFEGAALNRLGRFEQALSRLEKAAALGFATPGLSFDTGWAQLRLGRWIDAVVHLEQFEKAVPGRGKTSEFLGQGYFGLKQYDRAEAKLKEAIQREPELKATALLHLSELERERKNSEASRRYLETLLREAPDSSIAKTLQKHMEPSSEREKK